MDTDKKSDPILEDPKINVRIILAALWVSHFLLWTFGDAVALLQQLNDPIKNNLLLFVAVPLALTQTFMIIYSLIWKPKIVRFANIGVGILFILINIGFISEAQHRWEYLLGIGYLLFNFLIIWYAWNWPKQESGEVKP